MRLSGITALVAGLGKSGVAAARLLRREGARAVGADDQPAAALGAAAGEVAEVRPLAPGSLDGVQLVVKSPGLSPGLPIFAEAARRGLRVVGEAELAFPFLGAPVAGITGTNGKSTTTALTAHLLQAGGVSAFAGGNLGTALSTFALSGARVQVVVAELSSFQLEDLDTFRCTAAAVLNVTPDHLDRYASLDAYAAAKARIFANQQPGDSAVVNVADPRVAAMRVNEGVRRRTFDPRGPADTDGAVPRPRELRVGGAVLALRAPTLRGAHNAENALAACLLARHFGVEAEALQRGLDTYPGLPHRLEPVRTVAGVEWINDSKGTNVDSTERALAAFDGGLVLLLGGRGKGAPYAPLRRWFPGRVKALLTLGEDAPRIERELADLAPTESCGTLDRAVARAAALARPGDTVLLSPACASYDQFRNFEDRGEQFRRLVLALPGEAR